MKSMIKKFITTFSVVAIMSVMFIGITASAATTQITVDSVCAKSGETFNVSVTLPQNSDVLNFSMSLKYDSTKLEFVQASEQEILSDGLTDVYHDKDSAQINFAHIRTELLKQGGPIVTASFKVLTSDTADIPFELKVNEFVTEGDKDKPYTVKNGVVKNTYNGWLGDFYYTNGNLAKSKWIGDYYVGADGRCFYDKWAGDYYCGADGKWVKSKWIGDYYVGADGKWVKSKWIGNYYVGADGKCQYNKWIGDYYVGSDGACYYNKWAGDYYCGADGKWVKSKWIGDYYVGADGKCQYNKWIGDYYVGEDGRCYYNKFAGNYYCGANGKWVKNAWAQVGQDWYYLGSDGKFVIGTVTINGKQESFSDAGIWQG